MVAQSTGAAPLNGTGQRFVALDSLRGLAALTVVGHHLQTYGAALFSPYLEGGALAVDFFFVLSGFVIAASYGARLGGGMPVTRFMALRIGRIWPLHAALLCLYLAMETAQWLFLPQWTMLREPFSGGRSLGEFAKAFFLVQAFEVPDGCGWNIQSWSIAVEMWLYLVMAWAWRLTGKAAWALALIGALAAGWALTQTGYPLFTPFSAKILRGLLGFGLGVCCWQLRGLGGSARPGPAAATALEVAVLVLGFLAIAYAMNFAATYVLADLSFMAMVLVFAMEWGAVSRLLARAPFVLLGTLSYSIYLMHILVIARAIDLLRLFGLGSLIMSGDEQFRQLNASPQASVLISIAITALCVAISWVTWRWIEQPAREWSRRTVACWPAVRNRLRAT